MVARSRRIAGGGGRRTQRTVAALAAAALVAVGAPGTAWAAPPPNDNRASADALSLPANVDGTTVEATVEPNEPPPTCTPAGPSVWYRVTPQRDGRVVVGLQADGDLDAIVDVFAVRRSQLGGAGCEVTDPEGRATLVVEVRAGQAYLVRVARRPESVEGTFRLSLQLGQPAAAPPGPRLAPGGATGALDGLLNPSAAHSVRLRAGTTYRFNLSTPRGCTRLALYPPGTRSFRGSPVDSAGCGYLLYTPEAGEGGIYSLLASTGRRGRTRYRLMAGRAGADDLVPGRFIGNYARVRARLDGAALDRADLYRFDVRRRSELRLGLRAPDGFRVTLLGFGGRRLGRASGDLVRRVKPGRYFAVVRARPGAQGTYRLTRVSRTITRTRVQIASRTVLPGSTVSIGARVGPGVPGPVTLVVERLDPVDGWQFLRTYRLRASGSGIASVGFRPPSIGRYRVRAEFLGTRGASPSRDGFSTFTVKGPLRE